MDVPPPGPANGRAVVLLHTKNFRAATWEETITALAKVGYRVIAPSQIGFCASIKPEHYQYSFQQLAANTDALLSNLGVDTAAIVGHSTGALLATRYALMYPEAFSRMALVHPIGLEDWKAKSAPYRTIDEWYARELDVSAGKIRAYEQANCYRGQWKPEREKCVEMLAGLNKGPGHEIVAWNSALIYDMIVTQPIFHEFRDVKVPTTLMIGAADLTAIGKGVAPPEFKKSLGHYGVLGRQVAAMIPEGEWVVFPRSLPRPTNGGARAFSSGTAKGAGEISRLMRLCVVAATGAKISPQIVDAQLDAIALHAPEGPTVAGGQALGERADLVDRADNVAKSDRPVGACNRTPAALFVEEFRPRRDHSGFDQADEGDALFLPLGKGRGEGGGRQRFNRRDPDLRGGDIIGVALTTNEAAPKPLGHRPGGARAEERVEHNVAGF